MTVKVPKKKKVKATITLETTFDSFGSNLDEKAVKQIECWIRETLENEETIPLFIRNNSGEETGEKIIKIKTEMTNTTS